MTSSLEHIFPSSSGISSLIGTMSAATTMFVTTGPFAIFLSSVSLSLFYAIPWIMIFMFTPLAGVRLYKLTDPEICKRIQKRMKWFSHSAGDENRGHGYALGMVYVAYVYVVHTHNGVTYEINMLATTSAFNRLSDDTLSICPVIVESDKEDKEDKEKKPGQATCITKTDSKNSPVKSIQVYERTGSFIDVQYRRRNIVVEDLVPHTEQRAVMSAICKQLKRTRRVVAFLYGPPGSGKSMMGPLLARELNGRYCNNLKPWQQCDSIGELYREADISETNPLILAFDEFDIALKNIHLGLHNNTDQYSPIQISDKSGWNRFMDDIDRGLYPHLILLLTSNKTPEYIKSLDPAYIREGRVNIVMEMVGDVSVTEN